VINLENNQNNLKNIDGGVPKAGFPIWILLVLIVLGGVYYFLSRGGSNSSVKTANSSVAGGVVSPSENIGKDVQATVTKPENGGSVVIEGSSYSFSPSVFSVKAGQKVKLTFKNVDGFHDLVFETLDIGTKQIQGGQSETLEFTAPETKGDYIFYCSVGNHRAMGMVGKMVVE